MGYLFRVFYNPFYLNRNFTIFDFWCYTINSEKSRGHKDNNFKNKNKIKNRAKKERIICRSQNHNWH